MDGERSLSLLTDRDQWARCSHQATALDAEGGVQLAWDDPSRPLAEEVPGPAAGLAFDRWCRWYRSLPTEGRIEAGRVGQAGGDDPCPGPWSTPLGLAVDGAQRLYVAEAGRGAVGIIDLWRRQLLRRAPVRDGAHRRRPVDVAAHGCSAWVLVQRPAGIVVFQGRRGPRPGPVLHAPSCRGPIDPCRLAVGPGGRLLVLWRQRGGSRAYVADLAGHVLEAVEGATDLEAGEGGTLVVARRPGEAFLRFQAAGSTWRELEPLAAPGYDGLGIAVAPDGSVAYATATGIAWAAAPSVQYRPAGRVVTYRLDSGQYRTRWGRAFLDACVPPDTSLTVRFVSSDDDDVDDPIAWSPAAAEWSLPHRPDLTPPLPSEAALAEAGPAVVPLRRSNGREWPWAQVAAGDHLETYESPVRAPPGRYLWVSVELAGTRSRSPRVRALRVEHPGHRLLHHLPRAWSRNAADADFLQRFLAPAEGVLDELDARAAARAVLLDPSATPQETLAWLASFTGLVLDRRWPVEARRRLVAEAYPLLRRRGTLWALQRFLELYLGYAPVIVEQWRLRGLGGVVLGGRSPVTSFADPELVRPIVGQAVRAAGRVGEGTIGARDGFQTSAHRFSVLIPADLSSEQLAVVRRILELQRPAHTDFEVCELGFGMRAGRRLHIGLTSVVGPPSGWAPAYLGQVAVGGDGILGLPTTGARLGTTSAAGELRVG